MTLMIGATRVMYAMSRDGLLPMGMARTNPKTGTPVPMTLVMGFIIAVAAATIPIGEFEEMVNIGTLSAFFLVSLAVPVLRKKRPDLERPFKVPGSPVLPWVAAAVCLYLMLNLPVETWLRFVVWLLVGFAIYFFYGRGHSRVGRNPQLQGGVGDGVYATDLDTSVGDGAEALRKNERRH